MARHSKVISKRSCLIFFHCIENYGRKLYHDVIILSEKHSDCSNISCFYKYNYVITDKSIRR